MDEDALREVKEVVAHANDGNWFPFIIVLGCLGLVIVLFIYILNMKDKANQKDHDKMSDMLEKIVENNLSMNTMIAVHEVEINNLKQTG
jgi:hypothetical protein